MSNQMLLPLAILSTVSTLIFTAASASPPGEDLWPMKVGSSWSYKSDGLGEMKSVLTVKSTKVENGTTVVSLSNKPEEKKASVETYRLTNQGIMQVEGKSEVPIVKYPLTAGSKWKWSGTQAQGAKSVKATMSFSVVGVESIKIPAGTYKAAHVKSESVIDPGGKDIHSKRDDWYAPGVGLVKQVTEAGIFTITTELTSYKLK